MKNKKNKSVPKFVNEAEEQKFWNKSDASEYFGMNNRVK